MINLPKYEYYINKIKKMKNTLELLKLLFAIINA